MYNIYKIAYEIDDEIKKRKENEKPFYWEHIHPEVRELPLEEVEKYLTDSGVSPEQLKEMSKNEKYLAVSEGLYAVQLKESESRMAQLEQAASQHAQTSFLDQNTAGTTTTTPGTVEPGGAGGGGADESSFKPTDTGDDGHKTPAIPNIVDEEPLDKNPLNGPVKKVSIPGEEPVPALGGAGKVNTPTPVAGGKIDNLKVKRESQKIMTRMAAEINKDPNRTPEETEQLMDALMAELQVAKNSLYV